MKGADNERREMEEEHDKEKAELRRLRNDLGVRMEEMREYAGVCSKLEQNYSVALEEN